MRFDTLQKLDRMTGKVLEAEPGYIKNGDSTLVRVVPTKPLCVETFIEYRLIAVSLSVTRGRPLRSVSSRLSRRSRLRLFNKEDDLIRKNDICLMV